MCLSSKLVGRKYPFSCFVSIFTHQKKFYKSFDKCYKNKKKNIGHPVSLTNGNFTEHIQNMIWTLYLEESWVDKCLETSTNQVNFMVFGGGCLHYVNLSSGIFVKAQWQKLIFRTDRYFYFGGFV